MNLSSPNRMIWNYFEALRRLVTNLGHANDEAELKQNVAVSIMLSVTVVEAFLNIFFRVVVSEAGFTQHEQMVLDNLSERKSLDYKLKKMAGSHSRQRLESCGACSECVPCVEGSPKRPDALYEFASDPYATGRRDSRPRRHGGL